MSGVKKALAETVQDLCNNCDCGNETEFIQKIILALIHIETILNQIDERLSDVERKVNKKSQELEVKS